MRVLKLGLLELRRYRRGDLGRAAIVALVLLPLLYGTVYLVAFWNPYQNISDLPAAIVNQDVPATVQGQQIAIGDQLSKTLQASQSFQWEQTDEQAAIEGLQNGDYFYVLTIPSNFSASIASLSTVSPKLGVLTLRTNDANSYITSLIGKDVSSQLQVQLAQSVIQNFTDTSLNGIIQIRENLTKAASGSAELANGTKTLKGGSAQLSDGAQQVAAGNAILAGYADKARGFAQSAERVADDLLADLASYAKKHPDDKVVQLLYDAAKKINSTVDSVSNTIITQTRKIDELGDGSRELAAGAQKLSKGAVKLNSGAHQLSTGLKNGLKQLPTWNPQQAGDIANHVSGPIAVRQIDLNNANTYGEGFAPYFMSMSLWVALLVVFMLLKPIPRTAQLSPRLNPFGVTMVGFIPVAIVAVAQVVILLTVIRFVLGISPPLANLGLLVALMLFLAFTNIAIIQLLNAVFGSAGRLLALVLLMLQLCSCGGTYPVQMQPGFFQTISPYLPMTYAVRGIRHLITNAPLSPVFGSMIVLLCFCAGALLLTTLFVGRHRMVAMKDLKPELTM